MVKAKINRYIDYLIFLFKYLFWNNVSKVATIITIFGIFINKMGESRNILGIDDSLFLFLSSFSIILITQTLRLFWKAYVAEITLWPRAKVKKVIIDDYYYRGQPIVIIKKNTFTEMGMLLSLFQIDKKIEYLIGLAEVINIQPENVICQAKVAFLFWDENPYSLLNRKNLVVKPYIYKEVLQHVERKSSKSTN